MTPEIFFRFYTDGVVILPSIVLDWGSGWYRFKIHIGWLFWILEIEWPFNAD